MKNYSLLLILTILISCSGGDTESVANSSATADTDRKWLNSVLPLDVKIEQEFETLLNDGSVVSGKDAARQMMETLNDEWTSGTFFNLSAGNIADNNSTDSSSFRDSDYAIYMSTSWHSDFSSSALAVTQYWVQERNVGTDNYYLQIIHSDIFVNYEDFTFSTNASDTSSYDIFTVLLHELGHMIGLQHTTTRDSFMYSSLSQMESKRTPIASDTSTINTLYSNTALTAELNSKGVVTPNSYGKIYRGVIELLDDGTCNHKLDGKIVDTHKVKL